ncbi:MAG: C40 family peptidase [Cytophagaceae bacterium]
MRTIRKNIKLFSFITLLALALVSCKSSKKTSSTYSPAKPRTQVDSRADKVISTARYYTGTKYKFGGTTKAGMDCSGLTSTAFRAVNIELPRTSAAQSTQGKTIKLSDVQAGDLVFFSFKNGSGKVSHVGIVTEVKGKDNVQFIHASTKAGVIEENLYAPYYKSVFVKAVRVL